MLLGHNALLDPIVAIARRARDVIMPYYEGTVAVRNKADASPVTAADEAADALIVAALSALTPDIPVISEEGVAAGHIPSLAGMGAFWLVDPLDGTKEFIARRDDFTVNIALIERGAPCLGVVYAPARDELYCGSLSAGAHRQAGDEPIAAIAARKAPASGPIAAVSRSHPSIETRRFLERAGVAGTLALGSSFKFCLLARGEADLYPRFGRTMEWDTAAGHAVLEAAGGSVATLDGQPLRYGKPGFANPPFIARGRAP